MTSSKTIRSQLLVTDTCVVIEAHRHGVWQALLDQCHVVLPATVVDEAIQVARQFDEFRLRLEEEIEAGLVQSPSLDASSLQAVLARCPGFPGKIDPGELECLAFVLDNPDQSAVVCSSDAVVFRYLGWLQMSESAVSLEEVLDALGLSRPLPKRLSKAARVNWTQKGFTEALQSGFIQL